jgi:uncharacterized membrane protein YdbT with pleckstrin-like domain
MYQSVFEMGFQTRRMFMGYIESNLMPGEAVQHHAKIHWMIYVPHIILMFFLVGFATIFVAVLRAMTTEMAVTNKRVIVKTGLISRRTLEMALSKIETVGVDQGIIGRIFGFGTVTIRGTGGTAEPFTWVADPLAFRQAVQHISVGPIV